MPMPRMMRHGISLEQKHSAFWMNWEIDCTLESWRLCEPLSISKIEFIGKARGEVLGIVEIFRLEL